MKKVLIIDGQGGLLGKQMVEAVRKLIPEAEITAVGSRAYRHRDSGFSSGRDHAGHGGGRRPERSKKGLDSCE